MIVPIPFALVVTSRLVTPDRVLPTIHWKTTTGWTEYTADDLAGYRPIGGVDVPAHAAYLVTDVDTGTATLDVRAKEAVPLIQAEGRTPLTIDEGVSLLALWPGILKDRNAFFLPGARDTSKRVAALWVSKGAGRATRTPGWGPRRAAAGSPDGRRRPGGCRPIAADRVARPAGPGRRAPGVAAQVSGSAMEVSHTEATASASARHVSRAGA